MATIRSNADLDFDIFETAIGSLLKPVVTASTATSVALGFPGGFGDVLSGDGFTVSADGRLTGGTVREVAETVDGVLAFTVSGISVRATTLMDWFADGDYAAFFENVLSGADLIVTGSGDDRIAAFDGADEVRAGGGDDEIYGGGGNDLIDGGAGNDTISGGGGADTIRGGEGADLFYGSSADFDGDTLSDLGVGDALAITDADARTGWIRVGGKLTLSGGEVVTLAGAPNLRLVSATDDAGATVRAVRHDAQLNDFNGDGRADILWSRAVGGVATWNLTGDGVAGAFFAAADPSWRAVDAFDFNGDGRADILWRNANGAVAVWNAVDGGFDQSSWIHGPVGGSWRIAGTGDLNGDGRDDVLWRDADGALSSWSSTGAGFTENSWFHGAVGAAWKVAGLGDLNGDGRDDVVWRSDSGAVSIWTADGRSGGVSFAQNSFFAQVGADWRIAGVGDLNGDGLDDLLWRSDSGAISAWRSTGTGFERNVFFDASVGTDWALAQVADVNADGLADLLWHGRSGAVSVWESDGEGFVRNTLYDAGPSTDWSVVGSGVFGM